MNNGLNDELENFLLARQASSRAALTIDWYRRMINVWLAWLDARHTQGIDWLAPELLEAFLLDQRNAGLSDSTVDARFRAVRAFLNWLKKRKKLGNYEPPTSQIDRPPVKTPQPRQADPEDIQRVLDSIGGDSWLDVRDCMMIELLRSTGLRVDEMVKLRTPDVDLREGFIYVAAGKGGKDRIAPFDDRFRRAFVAYMFNRPAWAGSELILAAGRYRQPVGAIRTNGVRQMMRRRCKAAGVAYINPHSLRHAFAIKALNDGVALSAVSAIMGHSSPSFTARRYAKWVKRGLRREYDSHWQK
jgi:site-specific recombinase XerD